MSSLSSVADRIFTQSKLLDLHYLTWVIILWGKFLTFKLTGQRVNEVLLALLILYIKMWQKQRVIFSQRERNVSHSQVTDDFVK